MISVFQLLTPDEVARVRKLIVAVPEEQWSDGKDTAGEGIRDRKQNSQLVAPPKEAVEIITDALKRNESFISVEPISTEPLMFSRYRDSDRYDEHIDAAIGIHNSRRDVTMSIMLSDSKEYEGGELVFSLGSIRSSIKLDSGSVAMFSTTLEHQIAPVRGERLVGIFWIQTRIQDPIQREIIFRLGRVNSIICANPALKNDKELISAIAFAQENCRRMWIG